MEKQRVDRNLLYMAEMSLLIAAIIIMTFTPIGYIKTAGLEITLITIPVIVGAIVIGPKAGALLGGVFGITSFLQATLGLSPFGAVMAQISIFKCVMVCIPTRMLMGFLTGVIWTLFKKKNMLAYSVTSVCGSLLNTILFMLTLVACFWNTDFIQGIAADLGATNVFAFIAAFVGLNGIVEAIACFILAAAIARALNKYKDANF